MNENQEWKINKKNIQLVVATVMITATLMGIYGRFVYMEGKVEAIETTTKKEIQSLKEEFKLGFEFIQSQIKDNKDDNKRRTNTIRDRTDERLNLLERSNSDKP